MAPRILSAEVRKAQRSIAQQRTSPVSCREQRSLRTPVKQAVVLPLRAPGAFSWAQRRTLWVVNGDRPPGVCDTRRRLRITGTCFCVTFGTEDKTCLRRCLGREVEENVPPESFLL